ncbi:Juvenile hormone epoxide hydrolase-like protein 3 [Operophtera brumata]|uniref:Juvenile hormone epoxide hydrolase-like protein 3 n=1 Tax=Operophtera brumata TaxID=104452 RepID=A0A0L7LPV2_OPEBR|nr:Juvenile hormone epoxide hydrolase-like protein 3 [Operophtera brumata]
MWTKTNTKETSKPIKKNLVDALGGTIGTLICIFVVVLAVATVYCIRQWMAPPPVPEIDLQQYWGKYPMDQEPDVSIKSYQIEFSDVPLENAGFTYGFNSNFLTQVVEYWANSYNFKERERFLNKYNHFTTKINGLNIHYMHVKPQMDENAEYEVVPLLMLHGWPGSVREFYEVVPELIKPTDKDFVFQEPYHPSTSGSNVASASGSEEATNNVDLDASDNSNKAAHIKVVKPPKTQKLKTKLSSERSDIQAAVNELKELNSS